MKKIKILALACFITFAMTSCYTSKVYNGTVTENTPQVEVASKGNPILLWGLVPLKGSNQVAKESVGDRKNYTVVNQWTFVDGLLNCITLGIYSPTTTKYLVPLDETK